jgi:nanoRNase/pAp phosphatase (c-di-AMP/oligoRNAs hydrolase)
MRQSLFVAEDDFLWRLLAGAALAGVPSVHVVETAAVRARIARQGGHAVAGDLESAAVYRRAFRSGHEPVVLAVPADRTARILAALRRVAPAAPVLLLSDDGPPVAAAAGVTTLTGSAFADRVLEPELARAAMRGRAERLREHFRGAERILIMLQDDPDPDAIASALGLRTLLGRSKSAAPIATFGEIARPENRAMIRILEIEVEEIRPAMLESFDRVAMVDTQPSFFEEPLPEVDLVIDHHPEEHPVRTPIKDIRPGYGATATILTEYLRAAELKISQRLATALLYGIKADTLQLERGACRADMEAFVFLHPLANHNALRRIERPQLPHDALDQLAAGIARRHIADDVVFVHCGAVGYRELVAQFADLFLQVEGVEWSVVSGIVDGDLHVSVRNVGYVRGAGDVVRQAFGDLGSAGGHRSMAKAVVPLEDWRARAGDDTDDAIRQGIVARFLRALRG